MAKKERSIVEQENRRKKARELKRAKEERNQEKLQRLSQIDPKRLQKRIQDLELKKQRNNGKLFVNEQRQLDSLVKDLEYITRKNLSNVEESKPSKPIDDVRIETKPLELGIKSIFWDPEWNPLGIAPKGHKNISYPLKNPHKYSIDPTVSSIPLPKDPAPRFFKIDQAQSTYESKGDGDVAKPVIAPIRRMDDVKFVPSVVRNKKITQERKDETGNAFEEEEELGLKRKADQLD